MKRLVKKCIGYVLIFGFTMPAFGYKWTIYNATPDMALVQLNVTGQVMRQPIPSGESTVFDYNKWGGLWNGTWMGGLCLTTIYLKPMDGAMQPAHMTQLEEKIFEDLIKDIPDIIKAIINVEDPVAEVKAALKLLYDAIRLLIDLLSRLCTDGTWLITQDPRTKEYHVIYKAS